MKKKIIIIVAIVIFILMLIPTTNRLKDGGSVEYNALLYKYTKIHRLNEKSATGYDYGWKLQILGIRVGGEINLPKITLEELENIHKSTDDSLAKYRETNEYDNFASSYVDENKNRVIIELVDNSKKEQQWFRDNIYDSKYILFKKGGPNYTY